MKFIIGNCNHQVEVAKNWKVIDIGAGEHPFKRTDVTLDNNRFKLKNPKWDYLCNMCKMPFKNNEFDYATCLHSIMYVDDPSIACEEISRIAKAGYIEGYTLVAHIFYKWSFRWCMDVVNGKLLFRWRDWNSFYKEDGHKKIEIAKKMPKVIYCKYEWKNKIEYIIDWGNKKRK